MATSIALRNRAALTKPPEPPSAALDHAGRALFSRLTAVGLGHEIAAADAPTAPMREALERRSALLGLWLERAGDEALIDVVTSIIAMPSRAESVQDSKKQIAIYCTDLADLPPFAVVKACADFRQGRAGDGHWRPTQAEIRQRAESYAYEVAREKRRLDAVLGAKVRTVRIDPERRKAAADLARASIRDGAAHAAQAEAERTGKPLVASRPLETPEQALKRYEEEAKTTPPGRVSTELAAKLGIGPDYPDGYGEGEASHG